MLRGRQSQLRGTSEKTVDGGLDGSMIDANDDVITTRWTVGALRLMARSRPTVPLMAICSNLASATDTRV